MSLEYFIMNDGLLLYLLQFLKKVGVCMGDEVKFLFYNDLDTTVPNYQYNQYSNTTLQDIIYVLVDLTLAGNAVHC